ncbi:spermidine/putrescine transport system ATP-binding protein [Leifsonia sp. 98AMF]|uniref:ABC transporter ATP-binding protein n=1 Tax=unclassified Leifsonia TaxID=2663824 RepID=UPI00087C846D|nr:MULTISPECIES: ABC transporter ATP-binding protein [unclassified Leifsonia]SDH08220.1 spermidine/putrescine transport system ATP-binding protein [Leifsonia sp. 197AMF]SDJ31662.1 spermidine/putrescine transport system ATP-binding protein [Leifsonia sp. 466MF]SDK48351.1 spermidine/putrescine transport system ATP-binding protein [Leifsonia sp. 157MF]SDN52981.1 spermidine/putrescine transport system ATP-binding protein [Leifsonia sp. 509MF]SEN57118.1 spermidine/putrescine transport system ATP-bi
MTTPASPTVTAPTLAGAADRKTPAIRLTGVTKTFGSTTVVQPVDLTIGDNEFFSILGPSGCGKTTLMRMIAGFEAPTGGSIELAGRSVESLPTRKRDLNMLFQSYALFPHLSVRDNIGFELKVRGRKRFPDREDAVDAALALVRMERFADRKPNELSGGQRQRVALARAIVSRPAVVLLDEPLGALDQQLRKEMQVELKRMQREVGITFVYVTHDQEEALTMSDRIAVMSEGRVQQVDAPRAIYDRPANRFVAGFIGTCNLFDAVYHGTPAGATVDIAGLGIVPARTDAAGPGAEVTVAVRPERVALRSGTEPSPAGSGAVAATLLDAVFLGDEWRYIVRAEQGAELVVTRPSGPGDDALTRLVPGDAVTVSWHADDAHILAA